MDAKQQYYYEDTKKRIEAEEGKLHSKIYVDARSPLDVECKRGHRWGPSRDSIVSGRWCRKCHGNDNQEKREGVIAYIEARGGKLIGEYRDSRTNITIECEEKHQWSAGQYWLLQGHWCRKCSDRERYAREEFYQIIRDHNGHVEGEYEGVRSIMAIICELRHRWNVAVQDIKKGTWCLLCNTGCERARQEFYELVGSKNGQVEGIYYNNRSRLLFTCIKGHRWEAYAFSVKTGTWCPHCHRSKGEEVVAKFLEALGVKAEPQFRHPLIPHRRYDFMFVYNGVRYIIEFDGCQHFRFIEFFHETYDNFIFKQEIDRVKTYIATETNYKVIRVDYKEIDRIDFHIDAAFKSDGLIYVSTPEIYNEWLLNADVSLDVLAQEGVAYPIVKPIPVQPRLMILP